MTFLYMYEKNKSNYIIIKNLLDNKMIIPKLEIFMELNEFNEMKDKIYAIMMPIKDISISRYREIKNENTTEKKTIYIFGHKSPDTDTISSSIVSDYLKRIGNSNNIIPCRLGELNKSKAEADFSTVQLRRVSGHDRQHGSGGTKESQPCVSRADHHRR